MRINSMKLASLMVGLVAAIALASGCSLARIDYDPTPAIVALLPEEFVQYGKRLGAIRAGNQ